MVPAATVTTGAKPHGQQQLARDLEAVSYTHLRAHETEADLVCRLLLEKKRTGYTRFWLLPF